MSICGYHWKMGEALRVFGEGLFAALTSKAERRGRALSEQLVDEREEIEALRGLLSNRVEFATDPEERRKAAMLLAVVTLAQAQLGDLSVKVDGAEGLHTRISENTAHIEQILRGFEDRFEELSTEPLPIRAERAWANTCRMEAGEPAKQVA